MPAGPATSLVSLCMTVVERTETPLFIWRGDLCFAIVCSPSKLTARHSVFAGVTAPLERLGKVGESIKKFHYTVMTDFGTSGLLAVLEVVGEPAVIAKVVVRQHPPIVRQALLRTGHGGPAPIAPHRI